MGTEILRFADIEIGKNKFYCYKTSNFLKKDADIEKVLVCNKFFLRKKSINTLLVTSILMIELSHYMFPKTSTYAEGYDGQTKWMFF